MATIPFEIERTLNAPIQTVWLAITNKEQMKQWYVDLPAFKPEVGFAFQFTGGTEHKSYLHLCKIAEVIPGRKLTQSRQYNGYEGNFFVTFELFEAGKHTRLKHTHAGLETFPQNNSDFAKANFVQGRTDILGTFLKNYLKPTNP